MVKIEGVEIRIKSNGEFLTEYNDPNQDPTAQEGIVVKYIEAIPEAEFSIHTTLTPEFHYHGANSVVLDLQVDNFHRERHLTGRRFSSYHRELKSRQYLCKRTGLYKEADFAFGTVVLGKNMPLALCWLGQADPTFCLSS